jgi:ubiquinone/menaquinone biosynthesis C-methylase UbiE
MDTALTPLTPERLYYFPRQKFIVEDFDARGLILDVGAGGEGVIGLMKGAQVVAIDSLREELERVPEGPLKIVMDALEMQFLDCSFQTVTAFCTLLYILEEKQADLLAEVFRVLQPGGRFLVWDFIFPTRLEEDKDIAAFPVSICLPDYQEISAGYGSVWPASTHDLAYYTRLAEKAGFAVVVKREKENMLYMELQKPVPPGP